VFEKGYELSLSIYLLHLLVFLAVVPQLKYPMALPVPLGRASQTEKKNTNSYTKQQNLNMRAFKKQKETLQQYLERAFEYDYM
jgi:hypothetical protein